MSEPLDQIRADPRRQALVVLAVVAAVVAVALGADALAGPHTGGGPQRVPRAARDAGVWYCPVTADKGELAVVSVAAVGDEPATVTVSSYPQGQRQPGKPVTVSPGDQLRLTRKGNAATVPVSVRWEGGPAVASWRVEGAAAGGAPCVSAPTETWHIGGFDTAGRSTSTLHLFNPFTVDAVARVTFRTPDGEVSLLRTDDIVVESGSVRKLDLSDFQPEQPDLGVTVEVRTGRLIAQGELTVGRDGQRVLIPAVPEPALEWAVPYARVDQASSSWLSVINPSQRQALVELAVSRPRPDAPLGTQISVPAGGIRRIDLAELSQAREFGVALRSVNGVEVTVTRFTSLGTAHGRRGLAASAAIRPSTRQALVGGGAGPRQGLVSVYNPGAKEVSVNFRAGGPTPAGWSGIRVPPNGWTSVALTDAGPERAAIPVVVEATGPVVAGLRSHTSSGSLRLWSHAGVASSAWTGPQSRLRVRRDSTLSNSPATDSASGDETTPAEFDPGDLELPAPGGGG